MSYRLTSSESALAGVNRIAQEQLQAAGAHLGNHAGACDEHVHQARKCMKWLRALVRLVRTQLGEQAFCYENACYRDLAQKLAGLREVSALIEAVAKLEEWLGDDDLFTTVRSFLVEQRDKVYRTESFSNSASTVAIATLQEADRRINSWNFRKKGWACFVPDLRRLYEQGRAEFREAVRLPSDERLHNRRKCENFFGITIRS